jgi:glycosyltransferase involved in cell wall biosynthesis
MRIVFIAFNYAHAGRVVNGPGMCLENLTNMLHKYGSHTIDIFTEIPHRSRNINRIHHKDKLQDKIRKADLVIHWSGLTPLCCSASQLASSLGKRLILGPNLIDTVEYLKEERFLKTVNFEKILTVNERLKYRIINKYRLPLRAADVLLVGPDLDIWFSTPGNDGTILWKGNSSQFVKDIDFALAVQDKLKDKYDFKFIGYPQPYEYKHHIADAKRSKLFISTSLSETMGLSMVEQWAAGIPSVTHPKIYLHGINYFTGIITNRTVDDYVEAIEEIMEDDLLYQQLSLGARKFVEERFSHEAVLRNFEKVIKEG